MLYVTCKNPECRGEIKAPFAVRASAAFFRSVNADITCPFCRVTTAYFRADLHGPHPETPLPVPAPFPKSTSAAGPRGGAGGGLPR